MPAKPRLFDLFCCEGGAAAGYQAAGFHVTGVDIEPQPNYRGDDFYQGDAMAFLAEPAFLARFDAIHASPPCQGYTTMNNRHGSTAPRLIAAVRYRLKASGRPWVIENVTGARRELIDPILLTGEMFGLRVHRPRLFESNVALQAPPRQPRQYNPVAVYGDNNGRRLRTRKDGTELRVADLETARAAMEMPWATWNGCAEAVPPAYTEWIGWQLLEAWATMEESTA